MELIWQDKLSGGHAILSPRASNHLWFVEQMDHAYKNPLSAARDAVTNMVRLLVGNEVRYLERVIASEPRMRSSLEPEQFETPVYLGRAASKELHFARPVEEGWPSFGFGQEALVGL